ncbi:hypothetical protein SODALDRAFT_325699 [Sodiomyces alkalinus F11]|uniref:Mucin-7 n=1 Tax=Sodiomyces alkalinus (strain CBS 110278 / VKM F-3762 / F11) TaxID=1314773 RepID=A0A3N2PPB5_SODAK|nr:hypothetical protein SODALDRAFT_325699 [Sodiomyces alkalinus F11]ROT36349.1 hypothetical protein SODALDRAFT_325699 [Sodiomyces alkalinus F11]
MSQVKNLRAMFEQKKDASPPESSLGMDRGRSPAGPATGTDTPTPRPLSKVRSSFIAIEKDGRIGLRRDPSNDSARSQSQRRLSSNTEEGSVLVFSEKANMGPEPIPESPRQLESNGAFVANIKNGTHGTTALEAVTDKPRLNPDKRVDTETPTPKLLPASPPDKGPSNPLTPIGDSGAKVSKTAKPDKTVPRAANKQPAKLQTTTTKPPGRTAAISPRTPTNGTEPASGTGTGTGTKAAKTTREPVKKSIEKPTTTARTATTATTARSSTRSATPASTPATGKKVTPAPVQVSPGSSTGFVKPKVKSPTRPVNLPPSLMAPTAASSSKVRENGRDSVSGLGTCFGRSPSRASVSTVGTSATNRTIRRQRSTINHPMPSIGPPPRKSLEDHPVTRKDKDVDESFLARMMRPTQSSNSKVTDKVPVTPPRRGNVRTTPGSARGTASASASASGKKTAAKSALPATGSPGPKAARPAEDAPKVTADAKEGEGQAAEPVEAEADVKSTTEAVQSLSLEDDNDEKDKPEAKPTPHSTTESEQAAELTTEAIVEQAMNPVTGPEHGEEPAAAENHVAEADVAEERATAEESQGTGKPEEDGTKGEAAPADDPPVDAGPSRTAEETAASGETKETVPAAQEVDVPPEEENGPAEDTTKVGSMLE